MKTGFLHRIYCHIVVVFSKVYFFITDAMYFIKQYATSLWNSWKMIWSYAEWGNVLQAIKLTFLSFIPCWIMASESTKARQEARVQNMRMNLEIASPSGFYQQAKLSLLLG